MRPPSAIVQQFARKAITEVGLAPENYQIQMSASVLQYLSMIARKTNPHSTASMLLPMAKSFYNFIHERRMCLRRVHIGGAGNRAQDSAIVKPMSSL